MTKRPQPAASDAPKEGPVPVEKVGRILLTLLEKQGLAVVIVGFGIGWITGWVPCRLCDLHAAQGQVIAAQEVDRRAAAQDRKEFIGAVAKIAEAMTAQTASIARMDTRDAIYTCSRIADKDARISCIEVAVTRQ